MPFGLRENRVVPTVTLGGEHFVEAQQVFIWGWTYTPWGRLPALAVRKDVVERCLWAGGTVEALVHVAIVTNAVNVERVRRNQVRRGEGRRTSF